MIVVATWPILIRLQGAFGGRRLPAVIVMLLFLVFAVILPLYGAVTTLSDQAPRILKFVNGLSSYTLPPPPGWVGGIPLAGPRLSREWQALSDAGAGILLAHVQPYIAGATRWLIFRVSAIGVIVLHLVMTLVVCAILYMRGEAAASMTVRLARCIAPATGPELMRLAALSVRAVALGVIVTALVQAALAGLGLWLAGVPYAGVLTAIVLILCIAQLGPLLPLLGAIAWLFGHDQLVAAAALLVWAVIVGTSDNVLRPLLIKRSVALPLVLIIAGVVGGLISFGIAGLFIGPVVLGVTFALMKAWITNREEVLNAVEAPGADPVPAPPSTR
jgi:predicted PurR-regulated permease PerM